MRWRLQARETLLVPTTSSSLPVFIASSESNVLLLFLFLLLLLLLLLPALCLFGASCQFFYHLVLVLVFQHHPLAVL